ncbi:Zinc finger, RING-H2-type [Parasponia andersonii]|uniref:Zinc finger, RING-H2-type n=1 Tax=Parasponia andersonii TaxID=3476 RepID=A0A2P5DAD4_PARAD|nr:Zinc finger, RING-H2-type [Parasponia andersonii]
MAPSPSEIITSTSPEFMSRTAYIIIFSFGTLVFILTFTLASHLCRSDDVPTFLIRRRAFPIATASNHPSSSSSTQLDHWHYSVAGYNNYNDKQGSSDREGLVGSYPKLPYSQDEDMLLVLPDCAHFYHVRCGFQWLQLHPTCPMCRKMASPVSVSVSQLAPRMPIPEDGLELRESL